MHNVSDSVIFDLVRCLARGESTSDFGYRVYDAALARGLIRWNGVRYEVA